MTEKEDLDFHLVSNAPIAFFYRFSLFKLFSFLCQEPSSKTYPAYNLTLSRPVLCPGSPVLVQARKEQETWKGKKIIKSRAKTGVRKPEKKAEAIR